MISNDQSDLYKEAVAYISTGIRVHNGRAGQQAADTTAGTES